MRIVSGRYKGRRLELPKNFKARPTTDFAKENLFNILSNSIDWEDVKALDLFGGTGSISFELVSRGCPQVTCVEKFAPNYSFIEKTQKLLEANELRIFKMDVFKFLDISKDQFDFIFADPPYDLPFLKEVPKLIFEKNLLKPGGVFVMEHSKSDDFSSAPLFKEKRVYGSVNFSIFEKEESVE
ncbi:MULTISPECIES: RsmD family RNA methyltransferase [unclassified Dysgonomonas]|uniref:RsmD family RNA methyltransferase n=1 Tax=unclassified Dysgonomonas TaxID=2630389 RepID=UPI000680063E|nr:MULTISPECIES: RsmD family RNA methyltransferase [unclassified Dysgonomonas]MBD8349525.1 RsmD family RNA methyltransferase [Dysgonomonas sp. HGC4]MBF0577874.1 RsmD family RNA methyltransferase [Dysgonomonas sp. GY617]